MELKAQFEKKLIAIEIELGFLRIPKEGVGFMAPDSFNLWKNLIRLAGCSGPFDVGNSVISKPTAFPSASSIFRKMISIAFIKSQ